MSGWVVHLKGGPSRSSHVALTVRYQMYSFGVYCDKEAGHNNEQIDVHVFNTVSLRWRKLSPERPLEVPSMGRPRTAVLIEDLIYIWGSSYPHCNAFHAFDVNTHRWFKPEATGNVPEVGVGHPACALGKVIFIHGGNLLTNDIYKLDITTMVWSLINTRGNPPPASWCHSVTIIGTKMFVFGGWVGLGVFNNIRVFDTETSCWLNTPSQLLPVGRKDHSAFVYNGELYIFGASKWVRSLNDLWKFNPDTFSWKKVWPKGEGPGPKTRMSCCVVEDRVIFYGGYYRYSTPDDLYILDFSPSLKTLCKLAVIQYSLERSELPHDIRWELTAMTE